MPAAVKLREDFSADALRALAPRAKDVNQSRRLLSLAAVRDGKDRGEAAKIGGMDRHTLRDWVHRFNAAGPEGLFENWTNGPKSRLSAEQLVEPSKPARAGLATSTSTRRSQPIWRIQCNMCSQIYSA
jgi:transposase